LLGTFDTLIDSVPDRNRASYGVDRAAMAGKPGMIWFDSATGQQVGWPWCPARVGRSVVSGRGRTTEGDLGVQRNGSARLPMFSRFGPHRSHRLPPHRPQTTPAHPEPNHSLADAPGSGIGTTGSGCPIQDPGGVWSEGGGGHFGGPRWWGCLMFVRFAYHSRTAEGRGTVYPSEREKNHEFCRRWSGGTGGG